MSFFSRFLSAPSTVGAVVPSSEALACEMVDWIEWDRVKALAEYGPGLGAFTGKILDCKQASARYFAVEREREFVDAFQRSFPDVSIHCESVEQIGDLCRREGVSGLDAIVSGLPWAVFSDDLQDRLLDATMEVLNEGGQFVTFAYLQGVLLPSGRRFSRRLAGAFKSVTKSRIVWRNLPPAFVYRCQR